MRQKSSVSFFALHLGAAVGPDAIGATGKGAPELLAHQAHDHRALVETVIARHDFQHLEVAQGRREGADFALDHIQILYKTCIACQAAARCAGGGSCFRQRPIHRAVSFSCTPFCARRWARAAKSTWSSSWSWLKQEKT